MDNNELERQLSAGKQVMKEDREMLKELASLSLDNLVIEVNDYNDSYNKSLKEVNNSIKRVQEKLSISTSPRFQIKTRKYDVYEYEVFDFDGDYFRNFVTFQVAIEHLVRLRNDYKLPIINCVNSSYSFYMPPQNYIMLDVYFVNISNKGIVMTREYELTGAVYTIYNFNTNDCDIIRSGNYGAKYYWDDAVRKYRSLCEKY